VYVQVPVGADLGLAAQAEEDGNCSFALCDGTANQGQIAGPSTCAPSGRARIVLCENNRTVWAQRFLVLQVSSFYKRGDYIPGVKVDSMDVLAMRGRDCVRQDWAVQNGPHHHGGRLPLRSLSYTSMQPLLWSCCTAASVLQASSSMWFRRRC
jgi:pyruvate dehydrogenase E1 component alpha subunit